MSELDKLDSQIQQDVDQLREQFTHTRDLYREVCALLFFRYGITPTTNKLYRFVRKGSMSVPTDALNNFWKELREKSKLRIEHAELPEDLANLTAELMAKIWAKAQFAADESLAVLRSEVEVKATQLTAERDALANSLDDAVLKLESAGEQIREQALQAKEFEQLLLDAETDKHQLKQAADQKAVQANELHIAMQVEVDQLQQSIKEMKTQYDNECLLLKRDSELRCSHFEAELETARNNYANLQEQNKAEAQRAKEELSGLHERIGDIRAKLTLSESSNAQLNEAIIVKDKKIKEMEAQLANSTPLATNWTDRIRQKRRKGI